MFRVGFVLVLWGLLEGLMYLPRTGIAVESLLRAAFAAGTGALILLAARRA